MAWQVIIVHWYDGTAEAPLGTGQGKKRRKRVFHSQRRQGRTGMPRWNAEGVSGSTESDGGTHAERMPAFMTRTGVPRGGCRKIRIFLLCSQGNGDETVIESYYI
jgi:hypothetical protein